MTRKKYTPVAVVAGGSAGIGRATAEALLDRGYRVAVLARGQKRLDRMKEDHGDDVWVKSVDVSNAEELQKAADQIVSDLGVPEIWVNSAMLTSFSPFGKVEADEFAAITNTTYLGTVNGCRAALSVMKRGNIVNVGSGLAYVSVPNQAAYCGAKHAVEGFTQSLRIELMQADRPIVLSMVQLPAVNTPQFDWALNRMEKKPQPAPPIFEPTVAAQGILRAIDTDAREVLVGRSVLKLMLANILFPQTVEQQMEEVGTSSQKSERPADGSNAGNLHSPDPDHRGGARGSYGDRARNDGIVVDGDFARKAAVFGGAAALVGLGLLLGRMSRIGDDTPQIDEQDKNWVATANRGRHIPSEARL